MEQLASQVDMHRNFGSPIGLILEGSSGVRAMTSVGGGCAAGIIGQTKVNPFLHHSCAHQPIPSFWRRPRGLRYLCSPNCRTFSWFFGSGRLLGANPDPRNHSLSLFPPLDPQLSRNCMAFCFAMKLSLPWWGSGTLPLTSKPCDP
jgi:hypothetical protein